MSRADIIGILGILLTLILGIPSIPLFAQGNLALGALTLILALIILGLTGYFHYLSRLPPFTILSHHFNVEILDTEGKQARARKTITIRPNHPGQDHYAHRSFTFDGTVNFRVDPGVRIASQYVAAGDHFVYVRFPSQLKRFKAVTTWIELDCTNSFTSPNEGVLLTVDQPIKVATIEITLPTPKQPQNVRTIYRYSGKEEEMPKPEVRGQRICWTRSPKWGGLSYGQYEVSWDWDPGSS